MIYSFRIEQYQHYLIRRLTTVIAYGKNNQYQLFLFFIFTKKGICDVRLTALSGTIMSPNHPDNYPTRLACVWLIDVGYGYHTTLTFHKFMLEKNEGCSFDWLSVKEGNSTSSPEKTRVCGDVLPPIIEATGPVTITFNTDGDKEFEGFDITYQAKGKTKTKLNVEKLQSSGRYLIWCSRGQKTYKKFVANSVLFIPFEIKRKHFDKITFGSFTNITSTSKKYLKKAGSPWREQESLNNNARVGFEFRPLSYI